MACGLHHRDNFIDQDAFQLDGKTHQVAKQLLARCLTFMIPLDDQCVTGILVWLHDVYLQVSSCDSQAAVSAAAWHLFEMVQIWIIDSIG
ncbi:hypothetical protein C7A10_29645 [Pseudomonas fluorescens]|uniref:Uncharacterized protein n=1 Tax=Pseudomonas fluorescens TaxID=294 RepID=A0A2T0HLY8_PSEFL|nr:hypothetical protein C7A10_29645 [Pseudomonas fluorescens]